MNQTHPVSPAVRIRFWAPVASAVLLLAAFPPFDLWPLVFIALVPWLWIVPDLDRKASWRAGLRFGLPFMLGQFWWLQMLTLKWTGSQPLSLVPWLIAAALASLYFGLLGLLWFKAKSNGLILAVPFIWAFVEVVRAYLPVVAFPWALISTPLAHAPPLMTPAWAIGAFGVGFAVVVVNLFVVRAMRRENLAVPFALLAMVILIGAAGRLNRPSTTRKEVLLGQVGVDLAFTDPVEAQKRVDRQVADFVGEANARPADLIVLPEGLTRVESLPPHLGFPLPTRTPLLLGAQRGKDPAYQSALAYDGTWHVADKTRLVIFGEFVPGRSLFPFLSAFHLADSDLSAGDRIATLKAGTLTVAPVVCFEELFPYIPITQASEGAQLLAVISDDDWFVGTPAAEQLADATAYRAVETGLPLVRSTPTGLSYACDRWGNYLTRIPAGPAKLERVAVEVPASGRSAPFILLFEVIATMVTLGSQFFKPKL